MHFTDESNSVEIIGLHEWRRASSSCSNLLDALTCTWLQLSVACFISSLQVLDSVKPGFHYPIWQPELTARQHGPCWRVMETGHPSTRAVNLLG